MALPAVLADRVFRLVLSQMGSKHITDPRELTRIVQSRILADMGDRPTYYNYAEYAAVVRAAIAASEAGRMYYGDPDYTIPDRLVPKVSTISPEHSQYQYYVRLEIEHGGEKINTAVYVYSDNILTYAQLFSRAVFTVQQLSSGRESPVGGLGTDDIYNMTVITVAQQRGR